MKRLKGLTACPSYTESDSKSLLASGGLNLLAIKILTIYIFGRNNVIRLPASLSPLSIRLSVSLLDDIMTTIINGRPRKWLILILLLSTHMHATAFAPTSRGTVGLSSIPFLRSSFANVKNNKHGRPSFDPLLIPKRHNQPYTSSSTQIQSSIILSTLTVGLKSLHSDSRFVFTVLLWLSTFGISLERRTVIGKALSAPLATMALALTVANIGIMPFSSPVCEYIRERRDTLELLLFLP